MNMNRTTQEEKSSKTMIFPLQEFENRNKNNKAS